MSAVSQHLRVAAQHACPHNLRAPASLCKGTNRVSHISTKSHVLPCDGIHGLSQQYQMVVPAHLFLHTHLPCPSYGTCYHGYTYSHSWRVAAWKHEHERCCTPTMTQQ